MKTAVEELSPTRVRLNVEVPFEELKPSLDKAYREVSKQVRIPGFRPGRVPPRVIDMRVGRGAVLTEAVNDALPEFYGKAVEESEIRPLGQPDVDLKKLEDGEDLEFTIDVEIRPKLELPDLSTLTVTVDNAAVTDEDVEEYLTGLRERFASLKTADRAAEDGDYVSIDLSASVDGEQVEDAQASGLSYKIGSGEMLDGLDEALAGLSAGESKTFTSELSGGEKAGEEAEVSVTVQSVKIQELPELDDEFAQMASEFDTLEELREDTRKNLAQQKKYAQTNQARERSVEALIEALDIPLPEKFAEHEFGHAKETVDNQLERLQMTLEQYLENQDEEQTPEEFENELRSEAEKSVRTGIALDYVVESEEIEVSQAELSYFVAEQAQRMGVPPQALAQQLAQAGQLNVAMTEVARSKASSVLSEKVKVTDEDGNEIDVKALVEELNAEMESMMAAQMAAAQAAQEGEGAEGTDAAEAAEAAEGDAPAAVEGEVVSSDEAPAADAEAAGEAPAADAENADAENADA